VLLAVAIASLTGAAGYRLYDQPGLAPSTLAPQTIRAPHDLETVDERATDAKRRDLRTRLAPVLQIDTRASAEVRRNRDRALDRLARLRQQAGPLPYLDPERVPLSAQVTLRRASAPDWSAIAAAAIARQSDPAAAEVPVAIVAALREAPDTPDLLARTEAARASYAAASAGLSATRVGNLSASDVEGILDLSDATWERARASIVETSDGMLAQGIAPGLPPEMLAAAVRAQLPGALPPEARSPASRLLLDSLRPNLTEDREQMLQRMEQQLEPEIVSAREGEVIVRAGDAISPAQFALLDAYGLSQRGVNWSGLAVLASFCTAAVVGFWLLLRRVRPRARNRDRLLLLLLSASTPLLATLGIPHGNLPAVGLLTGSFYGPVLAIAQVLLLSGLGVLAKLLGAQGVGVGWELVLAETLGGLLAAAVAGRSRSREELAVLGGGVGLLQGSAAFALALAAGELWYAALPGAVLSGLLGLAWCVMALGISPYLERGFGLVTPIRLAELANPCRPLLQRLASEAPGTFQHTLFVASLAEAAARELGCNVELVRAGTLYHDIGKLHDPLGFIENQFGCSNKHDEIANPHISAAIIKRHVSAGIAMARKHGLPRILEDFIPEHQGTLLISYFYFQAQQRSQQSGLPPVDEAEFRYDGPIPQTRETGIVMLADGCEAALRSLTGATPEVALGVVNKMIRARWQDGQLDDAGLRREELAKIAEVFVCVWQQSNHRRIAYPKAALEPRARKREPVAD